MKVDTRYDPNYSIVGESAARISSRDLYLSTNVILDLRDIAAEAIDCTASFDSSYAQDSTGYSYEADLLRRMAARSHANPPPPMSEINERTPDWGRIKAISAAWIEYLLWVPTAQRFLEITWRLEKASMGTPYEDLFCVSNECLGSLAKIGERVPKSWHWIVALADQTLDSDPWEIPDAQEWAEAWYDEYWMPIIKYPSGYHMHPLAEGMPQGNYYVEEIGVDVGRVEKESPMWGVGPDIIPQVVGPAMLFYTTDRDRNRRIVINWR